MVNIKFLKQQNDELLKSGLSINKLLIKNSVYSIDVYFKDLEIGFEYKIEYTKDITIEDVLTLCDLVAKLQKKYKTNKVENRYTINYQSDSDRTDYVEKINSLLDHDLEGMYIIENDELVEKDGAIKIKNLDIDDSIKIKFLKYYNPQRLVTEKKEILKSISNEIEKRKQIKNLNSELFGRNINKAIDMYMDIVNNIEGIRHSKANTINLEDDEEKLLMDIAINNAIAILTFKK